MTRAIACSANSLPIGRFDGLAVVLLERETVSLAVLMEGRAAREMA